MSVIAPRLNIFPLLGFVWSHYEWCIRYEYIYCGFFKTTNEEKERWHLHMDATHLTFIRFLLPMIMLLVARCRIPSSLCAHAVGCCYGWVGGVSSETLGHICVSVHAEFRQSSGFTGRSWLSCHLCLCSGFSPEVQWQSIAYEDFKKMWWPIKTETSTNPFSMSHQELCPFSWS